MITPVNTEFLPDYAVPPGEYLQEYVEESGLSTKEYAIRADLSHTCLKLILIGAYPITEEIAAKLAAVTTRPQHMWLRLEERYQQELERLKLERPKVAEEQD